MASPARIDGTLPRRFSRSVRRRSGLLAIGLLFALALVAPAGAAAATAPNEREITATLVVFVENRDGGCVHDAAVWFPDVPGAVSYRITGIDHFFYGRVEGTGPPFHDDAAYSFGPAPPAGTHRFMLGGGAGSSPCTDDIEAYWRARWEILGGVAIFDGRPPGRIAGKVTSDGKALAGVTVTAGGPATLTDTTAPDGSYSISVPEDKLGSYTVTPTLPETEFTPASKTVTVESGGTATADFVKNDGFFEVFVETYEGAPAQGASISIGDETKLTNASGLARFEVEPAQQFNVRANGGNTTPPDPKYQRQHAPGTAQREVVLVGLEYPVHLEALFTLAPVCQGKYADFFGESGRVEGTSGDDVLFGAGQTTVDGLGGDDLLCASTDGVALVGGPGNDTIFGSYGEGGTGDDLITLTSYESGGGGTGGGAGAAAFRSAGADEGGSGWGGPGVDKIIGTEFADFIHGGNSDSDFDDGLPEDTGDDTLVGGGGADQIVGRGGDDDIRGGDGGTDGEPQELRGDGGNDTIRGGSGADLISGDGGVEAGRDPKMVYFGGVFNDSRELGGFPSFEYSPDRDTLFGADGDDVIAGVGDDDHLDGGDGVDYLFGHDGEDTCVQGEFFSDDVEKKQQGFSHGSDCELPKRSDASVPQPPAQQPGQLQPGQQTVGQFPGDSGVPDQTPPAARFSSGRTCFLLADGYCPQGLEVSEDSTVRAGGAFSAPGGASAQFRFFRTSEQVHAGEFVELQLRTSARGRRAVRRSLARGRWVRARIRIAITDSAGNTRVLRRILIIRP